MDTSRRTPNPEFILNKPRYRGAEILLGRANFGCGSSREHAPWALQDYGFGAIIAPSFADIFFNNCFKIGLLPIVLDAEVVDQLFREVEATEDYRLTVDLQDQLVTTPSGECFQFDIDAFRKYSLLNGLDEIGLTLKHSNKIRAFEEKHRAAQPWLFA
jgi:3-isopropylmalate/(R)-2-methylmalate dehydratase small subunit